MKITKEQLEAYRSEKQEIQELKCKLQTIVGTDIDVCWDKKECLQSEINCLTKRCQEVEQWIEEIPDSTTRRIFRMYYEDGIGQQAIAKQIHMDQSNVSKRISRYIANK